MKKGFLKFEWCVICPFDTWHQWIQRNLFSLFSKAPRCIFPAFCEEELGTKRWITSLRSNHQTQSTEAHFSMYCLRNNSTYEKQNTRGKIQQPNECVTTVHLIERKEKYLLKAECSVRECLEDIPTDCHSVSPQYYFSFTSSANLISWWRVT